MPRTYLKSELGAQFDAAKADALIEHGPRMIEFFERNTSMRFIDGNRIPDFHTTQGAATGGRSVCAMPFDGRELGPLIDKLRPPLAEVTIKGMALSSGNRRNPSPWETVAGSPCGRRRAARDSSTLGLRPSTSH